MGKKTIINPFTKKKTIIQYPISQTTCDPKYSDQSGLACKTDSQVINFCKKAGVNIQTEGACRAIIEDENYPNQSTKNAILQRYCDESDNMFSKIPCKQWVTNENNQNLPAVRNLVEKYCKLGDNIHKEPCKTFIKNYAVAGEPHYDYLMENWCKNNENDPRCACIMSKHNEKVALDGTAIQGLPQCVDGQCVALMTAGGGLIPSTMMNPACSYYDCKQFIDNNGAIVGDNNKTLAVMNMECGTNLSSPVVPDAIPDSNTLRPAGTQQVVTGNVEVLPPGTPVTPENITSILGVPPVVDTKKEQKTKAIIALLLLFVIVMGVFAFWGGSDSTTGGLFVDDEDKSHAYGGSIFT